MILKRCIICDICTVFKLSQSICTHYPFIHLDLMYLFMSLQKSLSLCVFWLYINKNSRGIDGKNKEQYSSYFQERHLVDSCQFLELKHHTMISNSKILDTSEAESVHLYFVNFFIVFIFYKSVKVVFYLFGYSNDVLIIALVKHTYEV